MTGAETFAARRERMRRDRKERWDRWDREMEQCAMCALARTNVVHQQDPEHSPEGAAYHAGFAHHEFAPTGILVVGAASVSGYVQPWNR